MSSKKAPTGMGGPDKSTKSGKAPSGGTNGKNSGPAQRRAKVHLARNIPVQPIESILKDGGLDLQTFVADREFEIRALGQSMASSKAVGSSRAFQQVPRSLRRRTASHNPRRVPRRLRQRAKREMAEDNTPIVQSRRRKPTSTRSRLRAETAKRLGLLAARTRRRKLIAKGDKTATETGTKNDGAVTQRTWPKIRRNQLNEPPRPPAKFRKRQREKTWLPTHVWHAKRAKMTEPTRPLWRFAIPLTPTEKIYRPTHRSQGERGTIIWDTSYMSTIGLYGHEMGICRVLKRIGLTNDMYWNEKANKWRLGTRSRTVVISKEAAGRQRPMCPCTLVWNPQLSVQGYKKPQRQVFLRMHPSAFRQVFKELLRLIRMETPRLYIEDLRFEIGSIELTGPASTEALLASLTPHPWASKSSQHQGQVFTSLRGLTNPATLTANAMLSFSILDPRLRYPPRRQEGWDDKKVQERLMETIVEWPVERELEPNLLFDRYARHKASCLPKQQAIYKRKSAAIAGAFPEPIETDAEIPVVLLAARSASGTQTQGSWTLMLPWKCVVPVWHNLVRCPLMSGGNPLFGGLNESMQVAFERSIPWFPADYPGTDAGAEWELAQREKRKRDYEKRPKSKRTEWSSLDLGAGRRGEVGDGLACDFELLFGLTPPAAKKPAVVDAKENADVDADADAMEGVEPTGTQISSTNDVLKLLHPLSKSALMPFLSATPLTLTLPANAITTVRISIVGRGVVTSTARIYRLPRPQNDSESASSNIEVPCSLPPGAVASTAPRKLPTNLRAQWLSKLERPATVLGKRKAASKCPEERRRLLIKQLTAPPKPYPPAPTNHDSIMGQHPLVPHASDLIGFVTSGSFNLAHGRGTAVGTIATEKVLQDLRLMPTEAKLCIVRNSGQNVGWLAEWEYT